MKPTDLTEHRRFFAEELLVASNLRSGALLDAFATVPRELFLPPGPWTVRAEVDLQGPLRQTPGADARFVYHNVSIAIDAGRMLFNGAPGFVGTLLDALALENGQRVLHLGAGSGYYTAIAATVVGRQGRVVALEVDEELARAARRNLDALGMKAPWVEVRCGDGRDDLAERFDGVLINAGVTHAERWWVEALAPGARMVLPLTVAAPMDGAASHPAGAGMRNISKGVVVALTRTPDPERLNARTVTFTAIYSAVGVRDAVVNTELGLSLTKLPLPPLTQLRLDRHEPDASCWCHTTRGCWSMAASTH